MTNDDEGEGGVRIPPKNDDVIYEQPPTSTSIAKKQSRLIEAKNENTTKTEAVDLSQACLIL